MAMLIGMSEEVKGQTFEFTEKKVTIGRSSNNIISLEHPTVSGKHCCISKNDDQYILSDFGSTNGTRLNGREVTEAALKPKDLIQVGSLEFMFDADDIKMDSSDSFSDTQVEVAAGPASTPVTFNNISPFGSRKDSKKIWIVVIALVALAAIALVIILFFRLMQG